MLLPLPELILPTETETGAHAYWQPPLTQLPLQHPASLVQVPRNGSAQQTPFNSSDVQQKKFGTLSAALPEAMQHVP